MTKKSNSKSSDYVFHSSFAFFALQTFLVEENEILSKSTMSLTLKKDSETHWCLMTLSGLCSGNSYDLQK